MESQLPPPNGQRSKAYADPRQAHRARASPPPMIQDPEAGYPQERSPDLSAIAMQPPRLQGGSCCSKLLVTSTCCSFLLIVLVACNALLSQPLVVQARASVQGRLAPVARPSVDTAKKPLPALLRRFGALKRISGGQKSGVDAVRNAFPRWREQGGSLRLEDAVVDLALGVAAVVEQLDPGLEIKIVEGLLSPPPPPSPVPEPELINDASDEDLEL